MTYAELAKERDDLKSENETLHAIMDKMLAKGNALKAENEKLLESVESLAVGKCALRCPLVTQVRKETAKKILNDILFNLQSPGQPDVCRSNDYYNVVGWIEELAEEYGVEVESDE